MSGAPVDPLFSDRDVFADFFTRYYTDYEPENALVAMENDRAVGYLLGCMDPKRHHRINTWLILAVIAPKTIARLLTFRYSLNDLRFLWWSCWKAPSETPAAPHNAAHFHFNILPEYRNTGVGRKLYFRFERMVRERGLRGLYGQIQTADDRRTARIFERYGFQHYDRREVTKFRRFRQEKVYVSTYFLEFQETPAEKES